MKSLRYSLALAFILVGLAGIPFTLGFGKDIITDTITQAKVSLCLKALTNCTTQCNAQVTSAPGSYPVCMQNCTNYYSQCISTIARKVSSSQPTTSPRPSIAPSKTTPTPLPRKTQPDLTNKTATKPPATTSTLVQPTPTIAPKKK